VVCGGVVESGKVVGVDALDATTAEVLSAAVAVAIVDVEAGTVLLGAALAFRAECVRKAAKKLEKNGRWVGIAKFRG
jgi:hypothetical protein